MNIKRLINQLKIDEGKFLRVYKDHLGNPTVGIGHLITTKDTPYIQRLKVGDKITEEICNELFITDLAVALQDAIVIFSPVWESFPDEAKEVFVNMSFNLGRARLLGFKKMIKAAYSLDWQEVSKEMLDSRWAYQVPNRVARLRSKIESLAS